MFLRVLKIAIAILAILWGSQVSFGQSLGIGLDKYKKGDIAGAEKALNKAMSTVNQRNEKAKIATLLGVVLYTKGDKAAAERSFRTALALDHQANVNANDALDPTVFSFFQKIKTEIGATPSRPASPPMAAGPKPLKKTLLKVKSAVSNGQVILEGIIAGSVNELINTEPGKTQLEVTAPGYQTIKMSLDIIENQENIISIKFEKIKPKRKPSPNRDNDSLAVATPYSTAPAPKAKKPPKPQRKARAKNSDLFDQSENSRPAKGRPERDLTKEFEMDAASSSYPQPPYAPPPPYQNPYAAPAYPNNYPPPAYNYPPPPAYPYQQPGVQPSYGPGQSNAPYREPSRGIQGLSLLPLGIGQFNQSRYLAGLIFLGSELGTGYMYFTIGQENTAFAQNANQYIKNFCTPGPNEQLLPQAIEDCSAYQTASQNYLKKRKGEQQVYLIATIGLAITGIIEAIVWDTSEHDPEPPPSPPNAPRKKKQKTRKYKGFSLNLEPHSSPSSESIKVMLDWNWRF